MALKDLSHLADGYPFGASQAENDACHTTEHTNDGASPIGQSDHPFEDGTHIDPVPDAHSTSYQPTPREWDSTSG